MLTNKSYRFSRKEHLKSPKHIALLFSKGNSLNAYPLRFQYIVEPIKPIHSETFQNEIIKVAFTIPKRKFKRAVDRNRIKRQIIEMFRLNREDLMIALGENNLQLSLMIVYNGDQFPDYKKLEKRMLNGLNKLCKKL